LNEFNFSYNLVCLTTKRQSWYVCRDLGSSVMIVVNMELEGH
jgi:hypothetical protein